MVETTSPSFLQVNQRLRSPNHQLRTSISIHLDRLNGPRQVVLRIDFQEAQVISIRGSKLPATRTLLGNFGEGCYLFVDKVAHTIGRAKTETPQLPSSRHPVGIIEQISKHT